MNHKQWRGKILYVGDTVGERGREWFHRTLRPDGSTVVRSVSEIDDIDLLRDVTYSLDGSLRPVDCYERLVVRGKTNLAWFRFSDTVVECEAHLAEEGRISQRKPVPKWPSYFGAHPLCGDALVPASFDFAGPVKQNLTGCMSSPLVNGSTGPLAFDGHCVIENMGDTDVTVPAGTFRCHYLRLWYDAEKKYEDIWCTDTFSFVKLRNDELHTTYILQEFEEFTR